MNRKLLAGVVALALVAVGGWWWWSHRGASSTAPAVAAKPANDPWSNPTPPPRGDHDPAERAPRGGVPRWSLDVDPDGPLRLEGQVIGADGKGIGGAEVWLTSVPPRSVKSGDDGGFVFDKLIGRTYALSALSGDLIGGPVTYKLTAASDPVVIHLTAGAAVVVSVVDDKSKPIEGADVKLGDLSERAVKTDAKGVAMVKPVHPGWVSIDASAPGYAPNSAFTAIGSSGATGQLAITLHKGFPVAGHVVDETGKPLAKVSVVESSAEMWRRDSDRDRIVTDDKGAFTFPALAAGQHTFTASDGEHAPTPSPTIAIATSRVDGVEIRMKPGGVLGGTVVDSDAKPVAYATVRVAGTGREMWQTAARQTTTDAHGAFELRGLARGKLQARAESDDSASKVADADLGDKGAIRDLKLVLDVSGMIAGTVVDETGKPVPEVGVNAFPDVLAGAPADSLALAGMSSATTDGAGAFVIHGLPDGQYRLWAARHNAGNDGWGQKNTGARTGERAVKIVMPAPGVLVGKLIVDGQTAAPTLATVQLGTQPPTPLTGGTFTVNDLEPGKYDVTFHGAEFAELIKRDIEVVAGKTTDLGTITAVRGRKLTGTVVDATGAPVTGARIRIGDMLLSTGDDNNGGVDDIMGIRSGLSANDGSFVIIGVPARATNVIADEATHGQSLAVAVPAGTDDPPPMTLALRGFGSIAGTVTMKGVPQASVTVSEASKGGGTAASFVQTAADGTFVMPNVPEGTHALTVMRQQMMSMKSSSQMVDVVAGKQTTVAIDIPVGDVTLTVAITPQPGAKLDAAQVFLLHGSISMTNGKQLTDGFFQGNAGGMKFWFGSSAPPPAFDELVPGDYSICSIPITGDMHDATFMQRIQENIPALQVYCLQVKVAAAPAAQTVSQALPAMTPLPPPSK